MSWWRDRWRRRKPPENWRQVESVMLAALTSDGPPAGPDWRRLD